MSLSLRIVVSDWLKINRPFMSVDYMGTIMARGDGVRYYYGDIQDSYVEFLDLSSSGGKWTDPDKDFDFSTAIWTDEPHVRIYAADPEFFEKLNKHLPPKL